MPPGRAEDRYRLDGEIARLGVVDRSSADDRLQFPADVHLLRDVRLVRPCVGDVMRVDRRQGARDHDREEDK